MGFEVETKFFDGHRAQWIAAGHEGEWALVSGDTLHRFYPTIEDGYAAGVEEFGEGNFLLKQVSAGDVTETIKRVHWGTRGRRSIQA